MAFEGVMDIALWIIQFAIILFPAVYILDLIRQRVETTTLVQKAGVIFFISLMISLAVYPFIASALEYIIALEYGFEANLLLFGSDMATYIIILLFIFLVYLVVFNKTK